MNHSINRIVGVTLSALAALLIAQPGFAQLGGSPASGSISASGANSGQTNNTSGLTTGHGVTDLTQVQNYQGVTNPIQAPQVSEGSLYPATTGNMARDKSQGGSVDMSPFPSGTFTYGFPTAQPAQSYLYQTNPGMSPGLPVTSTSSVMLNTVDCPFIAPLGDTGQPGGAQTFNVPALVAAPINSFVNGQNTSTQQSQQNLNTFFGVTGP